MPRKVSIHSSVEQFFRHAHLSEAQLMLGVVRGIVKDREQELGPVGMDLAKAEAKKRRKYNRKKKPESSSLDPAQVNTDQ